MPEYWLDPDAAGGGDGSESTPWNSWTDFTFDQSDLTVNVKRGTSESLTFATKNLMTSKTDLIIRAYGDTSLPYHRLSAYETETTAGDWTEIATDIWEWDSGEVETWKKFWPIGFGTLGNLGPKRDYYDLFSADYDKTLDAELEWDNKSGDGVSTNASIVVFSDENPVTKHTQVYIAADWIGAISLNLVTRADISGIHFENCAHGVLFRQSTDCTVHHCTASDCYSGYRIGAFSGDTAAVRCRITQNEVHHAYRYGIAVECFAGATDCRVDHNIVHHSCELTAFAGIYCSSINQGPGVQNADELIVEHNVVDDVVMGEFFAYDGHGIHCGDESSYDTIVRSNLVKNAGKTNNSIQAAARATGIHSNTGGSNASRYSNVVLDCQKLMTSDNSADVADRDVVINNNNGWLREDIDTGGGISIGNTVGVNIDAINNIVETNFAGNGNAVFVGNDTVDVFTTDDYNILRGWTSTRSRGTVGANTISSVATAYDMDDEGRTKVGSAALGAGDTNFVPAQDFDGRAYDAAAPNIGAFGGLFLAESPAGKVDVKPVGNLTRGCGQIRSAA